MRKLNNFQTDNKENLCLILFCIPFESEHRSYPRFSITGTKDVRLPGFILSQLLPRQPQYFRYYGSLTTPPCSQHLQWTLMQHPVPITRIQLQRFRRVLSGHAHATDRHVETADTTHDDTHAHADGETIVDNYRPFQEITGRVINYFSG